VPSRAPPIEKPRTSTRFRRLDVVFGVFPRFERVVSPTNFIRVANKDRTGEDRNDVRSAKTLERVFHQQLRDGSSRRSPHVICGCEKPCVINPKIETKFIGNNPNGRYCNANNLCETDTFEAWENAKHHYPIDENRVLCARLLDGRARRTWHMAGGIMRTLAAASPARDLWTLPSSKRFFKNRTKKIPEWYEQRLWHLYDVTDYARIFSIAQLSLTAAVLIRKRQAADLMTSAMKAEGLDLVHIIGPNTGHKF